MLQRGSISLFRVGETLVRVHPTFFLLLAWIAAVNFIAKGPQAALSGVIFIVILFGCVILHEFGHIYAARRYGIRTADVTLLPIGGVASLERMPEKPGEEIVVALAGPAVNLAIAAVLIGLFGARIGPFGLDDPALSAPTLLDRVAFANLALVVFNLIPAFPMDGGRVLRALLAVPFGFTQATKIAAGVGQALAVGLGFLGLLGNPILILVAIFVFLAASSEAGYIEARDLARGYLAEHAMIRAFSRLPVSATVEDAARLLLATTEQEFPVVDGGGFLRGFVTREALIEALKRDGAGAASVLDVMTEVPALPEKAGLDRVMELLQRSGAPVVAILDREQRFAGYVNAENLSELLMIRRIKQSKALGG